MKKIIAIVTLGIFLTLSLDAKPPRRSMKNEGTMYEVPGSIYDAPRLMPAATQQYLPINLAPRGLVILVSFSDVEFQTEKAEIDSMLNGSNYVRDFDYSYYWDETLYEGHLHHEGSARQYFEASSFGQYSPHFDVVGPVRINKSYSTYGQGFKESASKVSPMIGAAVDSVKNEVDFSIYDHNGDGVVDFVYVIYAGRGEADTPENTNLIWPKASYGVSGAPLYNGKSIGRWACSNEMNPNGQHDGLSTFAHEFSHVLGLPDFYIVHGSANHKTLDYWDIMDYGTYLNEGNTPPLYSAYERFFFGWLTPTLLTGPVTDTLPSIEEHNVARMITLTNSSNLIGNNTNPSTYWLLENRQLVGWDAYLPGSGLLLSKLNINSNWTNSSTNDDASNQGNDIIEADGDASSPYYAKATDAFPAGATSYLGIPNHELTDIQEVDGKIIYKHQGGTPTESGTVSAEELETKGTQKIWHEGQIYIYHNNRYYNLLGQPL
ncbi:MAG: M6 family metalloprotease domain-containing protein [Paludibacteraceae bacterium]|nr:M6 family metalloprotease domain-containing protein [Paludibacteraceae bacterium]